MKDVLMAFMNKLYLEQMAIFKGQKWWVLITLD